MKRYLGTDLDVAWRASGRTYLCRDVWRGCEVLEGLAFEEESPWRLGGLPNSRGRLACPSPLELPQTYSKRFAIDRVVATTGPKLFVDQIEADIG